MILLVSIICALFLVLRTLYLIILHHPRFRQKLLPKPPKKRCENDGKVKTVIVIGSGGHTTEILLIVGKLDPKFYKKYYVIASTDKSSYSRVVQAEEKLENSEYEIRYIPRSREVHQSFFTSIFTTLRSIVASIPIIISIRPELILCNGPGTCVPICLLGFLFNILMICDTKIVFIESICRVKSLSLSGKILRYIVDEFIVQWEELKEKYSEVKYLGRL